MRTAMVVERIGSAELKDLVARGSTLDFAIPVHSLQRLAALSASGAAASAGEAHLRARFRFAPGSEGRPQVHVVISGAVPLVCQRCLEQFELPVAVDELLTMVTGDADAEGLAEPFATVLLTAGELAPAAVVEDEVLAALPLAPKHSAATPCGRAIPGGGAAPGSMEERLDSGEMHRPMAGLADLLGRGDRQDDE